MTRIWKRLAAAGAALALAASMAACSTVSEPEEIKLHYSGGSIEGSKFVQCVQPATKGPAVINDKMFSLPISLRTWNIRPEGGDTDQPIQSATKQGGDGAAGPAVKVWAKVEFYLNTDCYGPSADADDKGKVVENSVNSPIVQFWEKTGRRFAADTDDGWRKMLLNTLVPAEESALRAELRKYSADELDANTDGVWDKIEAAGGALMLKSLSESVGGGNYFCGPAFSRSTDGSGQVNEVTWEQDVLDPKTNQVVKQPQRGKCPPPKMEITEIDFADSGIQEKRANVRKAEEQARADLIAARSKVEVANELKKAGDVGLEIRRLENQLAIAQACSSNPNCTLIQGVDGNVNVGTR